MRTGSITLMVLIFMTALCVIAYSALCTSTYLMLLAYKRENYEMHYQIASALHDYGIKEYHKRKDSFFTQEGTQKEIIFNTTVPSNSSAIPYQGTVWVERIKNKTSLHVDLAMDNKSVILLSTIMPE
jgi:hypothetical protein